MPKGSLIRNYMFDLFIWLYMKEKEMSFGVHCTNILEENFPEFNEPEKRLIHKSCSQEPAKAI